jgi:TetR/AcrR family fatty acid metabolism transcriptional regulator
MNCPSFNERRHRRPQARRRQILEAAGRVSAREGFETTIAKVSAEAGVAVGSIYLHFKNKEDLCMAVAEAKAERVLAGPEATASLPAPSEVERLSNPQLLFGAELGTFLVEETSSRRKREAEVRRREILEAAARVFARRGFHAATIAEVAAEAGVAVGSIYVYFDTKDQLYFSVVDEKAEELLSFLHAELARVPTALGKLRRLVVAELEFFSRNREFLKIYLSTRSGLEWTLKDDFGKAVSRKYAAYLEMVTAIIQRGIDEGELGAAPTGELGAAPTADLAYALVGMVNSVVFKWVEEDDLAPLGPKADWLVELFSRAAGAARG